MEPGLMERPACRRDKSGHGLSETREGAMDRARADLDREVLDRQRPHWDGAFSRYRNMFGKDPSDSVRKAAQLFEREGKRNVLELGCGQGRDTRFLAQAGFGVHALDYSEKAVSAVKRWTRALGLSASVTASCHDVREPLPFPDESFDACYSHMLFCMALTTSELAFVSTQVWRVLRRGGLLVYTARNTEDPHYGMGIRRGDDLYEMEGFIVHFLSRENVRLLASGYDIISVDEFEEGELPRRLYRVTLRKPG